MQGELVKLASFTWPIDAQLLKIRLEAENVKCFIFDENIGCNHCGHKWKEKVISEV